MYAAIRIALPLLVLTVAPPAIAEPGARELATQQALDALFSLSAVRPEGALDAQQPPAGFKGNDEDEAGLIAYLASRKRLGADLNAYRNLGTPLHHAIRAGLEDTARWLLKNGADPTLRLRDGDGPLFPAPDALGVAVRYGVWALLDDLRRHPAYRGMSAAAWASATWPYALDDASRSAAFFVGQPLPDFTTARALAEALLLHGLCTRQPRLVLTLLGQPGAPQTPPSVRVPTTDCAGAASPVAAGPLPAGEWKAVEARLRWPVLPFLAASTKTAAEARQLLAAGLRSPAGEPAAAMQFIRAALRAAPPAAVPLLRSLPSEFLRAELASPDRLVAWLSAAADWPLPDLAWALAQYEPAALGTELGRILERWRYAKGTQTGAPDRLARWQLLTDRLAAPLSARSGDGFAYHVPVELWPRWFALGYRPADRDWADWLVWADAEPFLRAWPTIARHLPEIARRTPDWLLAPLSVGPTEDPEVRRLSHSGAYYHFDAAFGRKLDALLAQGLRPTGQPRWLAAALADGDAPGVRRILELGWLRRPPAALRAQLERAPLDCRASPDAALRRGLASYAGAAGDLRSADAILPIARPGHADCAWLLRGGEGGGRKFIDQESFGSTDRLTPCADANPWGMLWNSERRAWVAVGGMPEGMLVPIRRKAGGESALLAGEAFHGTCGEAPGGLLRPRFADGGLEFEPLGSGDPVHDALVLQCDFRALTKCFALENAPPHAADELSPAVFADRTWPAEKAAFLAAIDRLDRPELTRLRDEGLFAHWLDEALRRIGAAPTLAIEEKRRRSAWVLAQRSPRPFYAPETLESLLPWLPAEDWGPILDALRCTDRYNVQRLAEQAEERKAAALGQRFRRALARSCGE